MDFHFPSSYQPWETCIAVTNYQTTQNGALHQDILIFVAGKLMGGSQWRYAITETEFSGSNLTQKLDQLTTAIMIPNAPYETGQTVVSQWMNSIFFYQGQWWMYYGTGNRYVALAAAESALGAGLHQ